MRFRHLATAALALTLLPASVGAKDEKKTEAAKPAPAPGPADFGPADVSSTIDGGALEHFVAEKEALLSSKRETMMRALNDILTRNPYYAGKANVLFRLAELEWEEARYRYFLERKKYEKEYEAFLDETVKVQPPEPKPDYSDALRHYKQVLQEFPKYERLDEVMYYLGKGLLSAEKEKEGASYFSRLIKAFPGSRYLPDSYFQVAEYYFNNDLLFAARTNYQEVLKYKDSPLYHFGLYKLGWVYYNLKEWRLAIDTFKAVVEGVGMATQAQRDIQFRNQAMNDLLINFAEVPEGWKEARDYFERLGGEKLARDKLRKMTQKFVNDDKNEEAIVVWRYFLLKYGNEPTGVAWYTSIVDAVRRLEDQKRLERVMRETVVYFDPKGTWSVVNRDNKAVYSQAQVLAEDSLDFVATWYHEKAQQTEDRALYVQAAKDYEEFLERFPKSEKGYKVQFFLSEIYYFELQAWKKAADAYLRVVYRDPKKGQYLEDSAYGSVLAARNIMDPLAAKAAADAAARSKKGKKRRRRGPGIKSKGTSDVKVETEDRELKPTDLNEDEARFVEACESFRKWLPKSNYTPEVMFYAASVLHKHDQLEKAIPQLETIVTYHPSHKYAAHAANSLFGANALLKKWPDVERWARFLIEKRNFKVKKKPQLQEVIAIALHRQSEDLQKVSKFKEAANKMVELAREFPKHELAPKAMFNAAAIHERGKRTDRALDLYEEVLKLYGEHEVAPQALFVIGAIEEARTNYREAADRFEQMERYKENAVAADAIYNAGLIREALGNYEGALQAFGKYMKHWGSRVDAHELFFHIAEVKERKGDVEGAKKQFKDYIRKFSKQPVHQLKADSRLAKLVAKSGGTRREVEGHLRSVLNRYKRLKGGQVNAETKALAAEARFGQAEFLWGDFMSIMLPSPSKLRPFRNALLEKGKKLQLCEKAYFSVFNLKSHGWTAAAATRIGMLYHRFSDALYGVPLPPGLSEDEQELYRYLLDEKAFPLQEKAIEAYQKAVQLATKNQVYNKWAADAASSLAQLSPEAFPITGERAVTADHRGEVIHGAGPIAQASAPLPAMPAMPPPSMVPPAGGPAVAPPPVPAGGAGGGVHSAGR